MGTAEWECQRLEEQGYSGSWGPVEQFQPEEINGFWRQMVAMAAQQCDVLTALNAT
jgi:hypothetical protein